MTTFTGFGSRAPLARVLAAVVPRLGEVSWSGTSEDLPFQTRQALGSAQLTLHSIFGPGNTISTISEREAIKALDILRQGPKPWSYVPDLGLCQWHDPLAVLLTRFLDHTSAQVSPQMLKLALKLAHHQAGDTLALTYQADPKSEPVPVSLSALAVLAFVTHLPDAADQRGTFYGAFRGAMVYATPDWWQPDATGHLLGAMLNRSDMANETEKRLKAFKLLVEEGLPVDADGMDDFSKIRKRIEPYSGLAFVALKEEMGQLHRELVKSRLDHISAPSSPNVRPPRL